MKSTRKLDDSQGVLLVVEFTSGGGLAAGQDNFKKWNLMRNSQNINIALDPSVQTNLDAVRIPFPKSIGNIRQSSIFIWKFRKIWKNGRYTKVYCHGMRSAFLIYIATRQKVTLFLHQSITTNESFLKKIFFKISFIFFDKIFCVAPSEIRLRNLFFYPIISPKISIHSNSGAIPVSNSRIKILWASRFDYPKNPFLLLEGLSKLSSGSYECLLKGEGKLQDSIVAYVQENNLNVNVEPWGDISQLLSEHNVFVHISEFEGIPFAIQEAMAAGIPVIANDLPGIRFIGGESILYVSTPTEIAEYLEFLKNEDFYDNRRQMINQRWNFIKEKLNSNWENVL